MSNSSVDIEPLPAGTEDWGYMKVEKLDKNVAVVGSTNVPKEWVLLAVFFVLSFIPMLISFGVSSIGFCIMVAFILYLNAPQKEVLIIDKSKNIITKEYQGNNPSKRVHSLDEFQRFAVEQSEKKSGAYRLVLEFGNGMVLPVTDGYYFSEKAVAQRTVALKLSSFLQTQNEK